MAATDAERHLLAMGSVAHLRVLGQGADDLLAGAQDRLAELEARWSRFLPGSDLCRVNEGALAPVPVAPETAELVELAVAAWVLTEGRFDPSILPALVAAGYDRSFAALEARGPVAAGPPVPAPGCAGIEVDRGAGTVRLPPGVQLDLGGIGKGRAADLVAAELMRDGAAGACVNLGGDVRVTGEGPVDGGWTVGVEHPSGGCMATVALADGAVATSTTARRRWGADAHHLIDPATGGPARSDLLAVTVVAADAAWAEVVAKAALVAGFAAAPALVAGLGLTGLLVDAEGTPWALPGLEDLLT